MLSQNSSQFELENQFILRMPTIKDENGNAKPHPSAVQLREALSKVNSPDSTAAIASNNETDNIKDRLFIELNTETRKGRIKFDNEIFEARLVDLPCIVESLKTVDRKTFFKTNDICQMLICKTKDDPWSSSDEEASKKKDKKRQSESGNNLTTSTSTATTNNAKKYQWPHGIAPPLKNVRRKRFRKVAKKKMIDYVEIEKEVKQLFRADREAVKVDYEVVLVDGELEDENIDDENKNSLNNDEDFDDSSQEDETNGHRIMMGTECSNTGTGYLDSNTDNLNSNNNTAGILFA
jgi:transcription initiation factor TFIID subunit 7